MWIEADCHSRLPRLRCFQIHSSFIAWLSLTLATDVIITTIRELVLPFLSLLLSSSLVR